MIQASQATRFRSINRRLVRVLLLLVTAGFTYAALVLPISTRPTAFPIRQGEVATQDIPAPSALTYTSEVLTERLRNDVEHQVPPVYLPADPAIARQQIELLRVTLNFISTVRADSYASLEQKLNDLAALENVQLSREEAERILTMSDTRWQTVQQETLVVLERVMRSTIREGQLRDAQRSVPTLISFTLPQDLAVTVASLVTPYVVPNSLYSPEQTATAREEARNQVEPVQRSYVAGEIIVSRGRVVTPEIWEALLQFNLINTPDNQRELMSTAAMVTLMSVVTLLYLYRRKLPVNESLRSLALTAFLFILFLYFARLVIPNRTVLPYLYPLPAFGLTIACLFNVELGLVLSLVLSLLTAYGLPDSQALAVFYLVSSLAGILILGRGQRIASFFSAGLGVGAAGSVAVLAYRMADPLTDLLGITTLVGAALFNGMASASLALILQYLSAQLLGLSTALQLLEISRPDHPLQQFLLRNAPGSYQHSLQVAVLAEQAAEQIGADSMLVRVGAIYHDSGKALNPSFYIENQVPGKLNPHDDLDPAISAQTIIRHVTDSVQLARKYRLPSRMVDFMREHHGTLITRYQYAKALEMTGNDPEKVDINLFRYPGPRPQSRETALLMLADGVQARARAELPQDEEELREVVRKVIEFCQREGQLDDTRLTLRDLSIITETFVKTLQNTYHPRIRYPEIKTLAPPAETPALESGAPEPAEENAAIYPQPQDEAHSSNGSGDGDEPAANKPAAGKPAASEPAADKPADGESPQAARAPRSR